MTILLDLLPGAAMLASGIFLAFVAARVLFPRAAADEPFSREDDWGDHR